MAQFIVNHVALKAMTATVPKDVVDNMTQEIAVLGPSSEERKAFIDTTGIRQVRFAPPDVCASDLAVHTGKHLLEAMNVEPDGIDLLIFLTQTPDYLGIPPTATILQHRLGLSTGCAAYDITHNCAGFMLGVQAAVCAAACGLRVLLLIGETLSRTQSFKEKQGGIMFGDAAAACLFAPSETATPIYFSLNSDGKEYDAIIIEGGGYRNMASLETLRERVDVDGEIRTLHHGRMDKMRVFDFAMGAALPDIKNTLSYAKCPVEDIDKFYVHQANKQIVERIARKLKVEDARMPLSIDRFGNTSTVSVPLGMVADLGDDAKHDVGKVLWSAFGGGLAWGTIILDVNDCFIGKLTEC